MKPWMARFAIFGAGGVAGFLACIGLVGFLLWTNPEPMRKLVTGAVARFDDEPENRVKAVEAALSQAKDPRERWIELDDAAMVTAQFGDPAVAEGYATELLVRAAQQVDNWNYGNAIHKGHQALGLVALRRNDVEKAKAELLEAGKTPGSPQLDSFGPNMTLAQKLLERGERDVVLEYFKLCEVFWVSKHRKTEEWAKVVEAGYVPDFGANLVY